MCGPAGNCRSFSAPGNSSGRGNGNVSLKISSKDAEGVVVLSLEGKIILGEESNSLRERMKNLLAEDKRKIVMNMGNVTYIDSAGLGTLVAAFHSARNHGAVLKLSNLGQKFQEVLQVTKLLTVFEVFDSEAAAIQSFAK
jgi:anti-sigma B factor antagonist